MFSSLEEAEAHANMIYKEQSRYGRKELRVSTKVGTKGRAKVRYVAMSDALFEWLAAAQSTGVAPLGKLVLGDDDEKLEGVLNEWLVKARARRRNHHVAEQCSSVQISIQLSCDDRRLPEGFRLDRTLWRHRIASGPIPPRRSQECGQDVV